MNQPPPPAGRIAPVAVGLFALWQLAFLPLANLFELVPRRPAAGQVLHLNQTQGTFTLVEPLQRAAEAAGDVLDFWSEATGQDQGWALFSDGNPPHSLFHTVELQFADGEVVEVRSPFEPADLRRPAPRPPLVYDRLYNFQNQFANAGYYCSAESLARHPDHWAAGLADAVRGSQPQLLAWLRWRAAGDRAAHPGRDEPVEIVLKYRYIPTPLPGEPKEWTGPVVERPYCRWRPGEPVAPGDLPVEAFDPVANRYVRLREAGR
ncbi:MAG TPA: hypothetical protein VH092_08200 [Urbifossiella sp.]|jgi:hypothetical protein|nr:hypothetical protein [Urbifossiella sp.]